ncbi:MAG TPA: FAD-binding oxidoreductase [Stellaceae bacterium]|nr:FAD-binding oxidoreductase [Stellaceae bacterium]
MTDLAMPKSLWIETAPPGAAFSVLDGVRKADICIVGGGFTGLSAALHLAEAGIDVVLLDAAEPGWGASGRNGGQVIPGLKYDPDELLLRYGPEQGARAVAASGGAADFTFDLIRRLGIDCDAVQNGWIQGAPSPTGLATAQARAAKWMALGARVEAIDRARTASLIGHDYYLGAFLDHRGGHVQPLSYARGLAVAAAAAGATIHVRSPAIGLAKAAGRWRVTTPGGAVEADRVILATNGYTDLAGRGEPFGSLAHSVLPAFSYQIATRPLTDNLRRQVLAGDQSVSETRRLLIYYRFDREGRLVLGGRGHFRDTSEPEFFRHIERAFATLFPNLADQPIAHRWGGRIAMTQDHLPHLHEPAPGLTAGLGYNGRGVAMATVMGKILADQARGTTELPLPTTPVTGIPFAGFRRPIGSAFRLWYGVLDWRERRLA